MPTAKGTRNVSVRAWNFTVCTMACILFDKRRFFVDATKEGGGGPPFEKQKVEIAQNCGNTTEVTTLLQQFIEEMMSCKS